jgi:NAD(P)-dependent dehydrogenase (short-subunit alcohol dehydrogenase family)
LFLSLINNAGLALFGPTADLEVDQFDALFASNVRARGCTSSRDDVERACSTHRWE